MPIETICQGCGHTLRVADEFAGRKARCPKCKTIYLVPAAAAESQAANLWRVRSPDGSVYGPVAKEELDEWLAEGRLAADMHLQKEGERDWQPAARIYPVLNPVPVQKRNAGAGTSRNPFAETPGTAPNPYASPHSEWSERGRARYQVPHRGTAILTLGVLGLICCSLCSPVAWAMGYTDLNQIREGRMDPAGRGTTQAGMVLGIIGTVILGLSVLAPVLLALLDALT